MLHSKNWATFKKLHMNTWPSWVWNKLKRWCILSRFREVQSSRKLSSSRLVAETSSKLDTNKPWKTQVFRLVVSNHSNNGTIVKFRIIPRMDNKKCLKHLKPTNQSLVFSRFSNQTFDQGGSPDRRALAFPVAVANQIQQARWKQIAIWRKHQINST